MMNLFVFSVQAIRKDYRAGGSPAVCRIGHQRSGLQKVCAKAMRWRQWKRSWWTSTVHCRRWPCVKVLGGCVEKAAAAVRQMLWPKTNGRRDGVHCGGRIRRPATPEMVAAVQ